MDALKKRQTPTFYSEVRPPAFIGRAAGVRLHPVAAPGAQSAKLPAADALGSGGAADLRRVAGLKGHQDIWAWLKIKQGQTAEPFWPMSPLTRVPLWYRLGPPILEFRFLGATAILRSNLRGLDGQKRELGIFGSVASEASANASENLGVHQTKDLRSPFSRGIFHFHSLHPSFYKSSGNPGKTAGFSSLPFFLSGTCNQETDLAFLKCIKVYS